MKFFLKCTFLIILVLAVLGVFFWQQNKAYILKKQITNAVYKGSDSNYYIHYDSSIIDEQEGNATFFNIVLQVDSLQNNQLAKADENRYETILFNVHIQRVTIAGANIKSFLQANTIEANSIEIVKPVITIISNGKLEKIILTVADTLALYKKIIGNFKSIQAKQISITDATIAFVKGNMPAYATLQGVNIKVQNFKIDSSRDYNNLVSYFVNDIEVRVKNAILKNYTTNRLYVFEDIIYNATNKYLGVKKISQSNLGTGTNLISVTNNRLSGLSTKAFIIYKQLKADTLSTDGGSLAFYRKIKKVGLTETIEINNDFFDEATVKNIHIGSTKVSIYSPSANTDQPIVFKNVTFNAAYVANIYDGTTLNKLLSSSQWVLTSEGTSLLTVDKAYNINIGAFKIDNYKKQMDIEYITMKSILSEAAFVKSLNFQKDIFKVRLQNMALRGFNFMALIEKNALIAEAISMQPTIHVFNDRTVLASTQSKVGNYPQQVFYKMNTPVHVKKIILSNGYISYRERGAVSKQVGNVFFNDINATLINVTNVDSVLKQNSTITANVENRFLDITHISSQWQFMMLSTNGTFNVTGKVNAFNAAMLNPIIEPLGRGSVKSGNIKSYAFSLQGNEYKGVGEATLLYDNLNMNILQNKANTAKRQVAASILANFIIKNDNPHNGNLRKVTILFNRVITKSFFNLVWKSLFDGAQKSIK